MHYTRKISSKERSVPRPPFFLVAVLNTDVMAGAGAPCGAVRRKGPVILMIPGFFRSHIVLLIFHEKVTHFQFESVILLLFEMKSSPNNLKKIPLQTYLSPTGSDCETWVAGYMSYFASILSRFPETNTGHDIHQLPKVFLK